MFKKLILQSSLVLTTGLFMGLNQNAQAADNYNIDSSHSTVVFSAKHYGVANYYGLFNKIEGNVQFDKNPANIKVNLKIKADSIFTNHRKRDAHLKGPDFLNAKQFPWITFKSTNVSKAGNNYNVKGNLTLHGVTKPITLSFKKVGEGKDPRGNLRAGGEAKFSIKRSDFGMKYGVPNLGDQINLIVSLEGVKK